MLLRICELWMTATGTICSFLVLVEQANRSCCCHCPAHTASIMTSLLWKSAPAVAPCTCRFLVLEYCHCTLGYAMRANLLHM
eukprot:1146476-Pelagomonas_calceolata.AAC.3